VGDKLHGREGNSPDRRLRSLNSAKWKRMSSRPDNQEVGLEAATLERVRNSSLVKWFGADDVAGLSVIPKPRDSDLRVRIGRGASRGERSGGVSQPWTPRE
jgi:hypothetical protein